jgi:hypothetical protein
MKSLYGMMNLNAKFTQSPIASIAVAGRYPKIVLRHRHRRQGVRIFYFDPENGLYQGEGFMEAFRPDAHKGVTTAAPPQYQKGEVPVFDHVRQCWTIQSVADWVGRPDNRQ